jgi:hypothetical protein
VIIEDLNRILIPARVVLCERHLAFFPVKQIGLIVAWFQVPRHFSFCLRRVQVFHQVWDYKQNIIYLNIRNLNTFCAINKTSGELIWSCGEHGNFKLLNTEGQIVKSLWYHSHALKQASNGVFEMFDNEFHNQTNPQNANSRLN